MKDSPKPQRATVERIEIGALELLVVDIPLASDPSHDPTRAPAYALLSPSEREVARLAFEGLSNKEIAKVRAVSAKTVANQLRAIYAKLGINSRFELAAKLSS